MLSIMEVSVNVIRGKGIKYKCSRVHILIMKGTAWCIYAYVRAAKFTHPHISKFQKKKKK